jgi:RimJ/RimL family protein N-acetyltransferase
MVHPGMPEPAFAVFQTLCERNENGPLSGRQGFHLMNYACLKTQIFTENSYQIISLREQDIYLIKEWRNAQIDVLRQDAPLTDEMQKKYFENVIRPSFALSQPNQILFSFLKDDQLIGYGGIVHVEWKVPQGEVSFLVDPQRSANPAVYDMDFSSFLKLIKTVAFKNLHFKRLYTETYAIRTDHISILERAGFVKERRLKNWVKVKEKFVDALIHGCSA